MDAGVACYLMIPHRPMVGMLRNKYSTFFPPPISLSISSCVFFSYDRRLSVKSRVMVSFPSQNSLVNRDIQQPNELRPGYSSLRGEGTTRRSYRHVSFFLESMFKENTP
jgi:hypothetical protein